MLLISHRGNLDGREPERENSPDFILEAVNAGFDVEVDVWSLNSKLFLGHDAPQYKIEQEWLTDLPLWCHAKNEEALSVLLSLNMHCFWHEKDRFTLTSKGIPWCYPNNYLPNGIVVMENDSLPNVTVEGICTDYPLRISKKER